MTLDGSGDYVNVVGSPSLDLTGAYTLEAWLSTNGPNASWLTKDGHTNFAYIVWDGVLAHNWHHGSNAGQWCGVPSYTPSTVWHHVAASFDGGTMRVYLDGQLSATCGASPAHSHPANPLHIGFFNNAYLGPQYFSGMIDEVRIWIGARSGAEINQTMNLSIDASSVNQFPNLVSSWTFDGNALDSTGTNPGTFVGDATTVLAPGVPVVPSVIAYPGAGADLALTLGNVTQIAGADAGVVGASAGSHVSTMLFSPLGSYGLTVPILAAQLFPTGSPPIGPVLFPEVHLGTGLLAPFPIVLLYDGTAASFFNSLLPSSGLSLLFTMPSLPAGNSIMIQGFVLAPNPNNAVFTSTDAFEIQTL